MVKNGRSVVSFEILLGNFCGVGQATKLGFGYS